MATYHAGDLARDAARYVAEGLNLQANHQANDTGCCRVCGRVAPCDDAQRGQQLVTHYQPYAPRPSALVRPYVKVGSLSHDGHGLQVQPRAT